MKFRVNVCSPRASVRDGCLPLQLGLGDSNPAWLTPAEMPHPNVELIKPAAVASSIPAVCFQNYGAGWSPVPSHEACREWRPAQDIPIQANVQPGEVRAAGGRLTAV